jgi:hypothetical protein
MLNRKATNWLTSKFPEASLATAWYGIDCVWANTAITAQADSSINKLFFMGRLS